MSADDWDTPVYTPPVPTPEPTKVTRYAKAKPVLCENGQHYMKRDGGGLRCWECTRCGKRQPFNVEGDA